MWLRQTLVIASGQTKFLLSCMGSAFMSQGLARFSIEKRVNRETPGGTSGDGRLVN